MRPLIQEAQGEEATRHRSQGTLEQIPRVSHWIQEVVEIQSYRSQADLTNHLTKQDYSEESKG